MPTEIDLGQPPAGYAVSSARAEEDITVQFREFTSTEDGQHFVRRLEGFPNDILNKCSSQTIPSQVDHMLAIVRMDGKATAYVNELELKTLCRMSGSKAKGEIVKKSDIRDIERLELGVQIPIDAGFLFLFSAGWRKGLFYDFGPVFGPDSQPREYDVDAILSRAYCHVLFQERFSISDDEWDALFAAKWFPFAGLSHESIDALVAYVRSGWDPDDKIDDILVEVKKRVPQMLESWRKHSSLAPHISILECAVERFQNDDFISCTGSLFTRIEGIMRTNHTSLAASNRPSSNNLADTAVAGKISNEKSLLLPHRFADYLRGVYFANFDPADQNIKVSRHSVGHGVADASEFDRKSALIAILIVHQLFYFLENKRSDQG